MEQNRNLKFEKISKLAEETSARIMQDANEWKNYLTTEGQVYKYPFCDQLLIHAQRPDATACASLQIWNEKMQCRVNRGAKGIALIDTDSKYPKLKYVFDISDVHKEKNIGRYPYLWELNEEHKELILAQLEKTYGMTDPQMPFEKRIIEISKAAAADYCKDFMADSSFSETIAYFEAESTLASSIAYTVLSRCGIEKELWEKELDFKYIGKFNTQNDLAVIGNANTEICRALLMEIGKTIRVYEQETVKEKILQNTDIGLEKDTKLQYNTLKRESETVNQTIETEGMKNGTDLQAGGGLSDTKSDNRRGAGTGDDKIRTNAEKFPEGAQKRDLSGNAVVGQAYSTLPGNAGTGRTEDGYADSADGESRRRDGGAESVRPATMGSKNEQYQTFRGGNRTDGVNLQLIKEPDSDEKSLSGSFMGNRAANGSTGFSPKEKFRRNMEAIRTLTEIESENRIATPGEQQILKQYVGWGGLADAFDETKENWTNEYQELKRLLSPEEYASARESTLNAHYTSPDIIKNIYAALDRMGFEKGNILEPAMGIGNFFDMLPKKMQKSGLYGVELDSLTGRIAKQLHPEADIRICGFEKTDYPNDFFDVAVGNVPFGQYKVADRQYDRQNFLIHDYFLAKSLDKVRPGGVLAFVTSKGTMDKKSPEVRKYLAQRAELLGAVRLPNTAFKENAGTEVTSDILFLKKRDRVMDLEPDWVHLSEDGNGIAMNSYFVQHPEMIVGKMEMVSGPFGMESACRPDATRDFAQQLRDAIDHINGTVDAAELDGITEELADAAIPADPNVKNYSYTLSDDKVYYRENSLMRPVELSDSMQERIKGMIGIRNCTRELIRLQLEEYPDNAIVEKQAELNRLYDDFSKQYGLISSQTNKRAFHQDSSYCLLCSLEKINDEGNFIGKADMFSRRTIKKAEAVTSVDTASEALAVSLSEKAKVDLDYMAELAGKSTDTIKEELAGIIFQNPITDVWETADAYLSGNVRNKLETAKVYAQNNPEFAINVQALTQIQPKELDASEIEVRIGATWIEPKYIEEFMRDTFKTPQHLLNGNIMGVQFSDVTGQWNVKGKNADFGNSLVNMTYGTSRRNAYTILEDSLNLKDSRVYDTVVEDGKEKRVLNKKETMIVSQKQEAIREAFKDWIFRDPARRQELVEKYNKLFNSTRPREYDGSHLNFPGMTPDIELKPHQKNAVAHVLYGGNTLLAHCVGAGKTFEMTAAAMESKRLGLCQKSLFVVPNHLTEQWASDFLRLYPGANILAATKKDFEPANRKKFCSRIATGDYDAVIIGHSQFEKIPLSQERQAATIERQAATIERQINEIELAIAQAKADNGERYTIKQMEKSRKALKARLEKLNDATRKDNTVTFEQLGVDRLFVDESHNYKNLFLYTKMRNVAGIAQSEAQKSSDMFAKCQYLDDVICCEL